MDYIIEPSKKIPVDGAYSVAVVGGGIAGISAALAAKRSGAKRVLLIERQYMLGGLATLGLVTVYLPICDGWGNQTCFGIAEELLKLSIKYGYEGMYPNAWLENKSKAERAKQRFQVRYNPSLFAILAEQLLIEEGVEILYGSFVCDVIAENGKITYLILENKSQRSAVKIESVVDASGDADICKLSGAQTAVYTDGNILASWYYFVKNGKYDLKMLGLCEAFQNDDNAFAKRYTGIDERELTQMTIESHKNLLNHFLSESGGKMSIDNAIATVAAIPQVRKTRRIKGIYDVDISDSYKHFEDSIGVIPDWRKPGDVYEIPLRSLYGNDIKNLITAGRCISATNSMWELTRVIPACAVTGEAAGTAAAMTDNFASVDIKHLQKQLTANGAVISCEHMGRGVSNNKKI